MKTPSHLPWLLLLTLALLTFIPRAYPEDNPGITLPQHGDKYSEFVKQLEAGHTDIDYQAFRESLIESKQLKVIGEQLETLTALRNKLPELMEHEKYLEIIATTQKILSIDYTDMQAHKILHQTYKILADSASHEQHHAIEIGLLKSIVSHGDGKTPATAWPVVQINEEYFILEMLGAKLIQQSLIHSPAPCDQMDVETKDGKATYYFNVTKVFEGYKKLGLP